MKNIKIIFRNILQYKLFTGLNLAGLSIALTSVLLIAGWVYHEAKYDTFNTNFDRIYQVNWNSKGQWGQDY